MTYWNAAWHLYTVSNEKYFDLLAIIFNSKNDVFVLTAVSVKAICKTPSELYRTTLIFKMSRPHVWLAEINLVET